MDGLTLGSFWSVRRHLFSAVSFELQDYHSENSASRKPCRLAEQEFLLEVFDYLVQKTMGKSMPEHQANGGQALLTWFLKSSLWNSDFHFISVFVSFEIITVRILETSGKFEH